MPSESTATLRQIAFRLTALRRQKKFADTELLQLLKSGELTAGFHFPRPSITWIDIPVQYWAAISSDRFMSIRTNKESGLRGVYPVSVADFAPQYLNLIQKEVSQASNGDLKQQLLNELEVVVRTANKQFEAVIKEQNWRDYLNRHGLDEPDPTGKTNAGRKQSTGWKELCKIIGAHILAHKLEKLDGDAALIYATAQKEGVPELPKTATIRDVLSEIKKRAAN